VDKKAYFAQMSYSSRVYHSTECDNHSKVVPTFSGLYGCHISGVFWYRIKVYWCWWCLILKPGFIRICPAVVSRIMSVFFFVLEIALLVVMW